MKCRRSCSRTPFNSEVVPDANEEARDVVRAERSRPIHVGREDECVVDEGDLGFVCPPLDLPAVLLKQRDGDIVESNLTLSSGLRGLLVRTPVQRRGEIGSRRQCRRPLAPTPQWLVGVA